MDLERAKTIADVSQVIINSAKVEVDFLKATGQRPESEFLPAAPSVPAPAALPEASSAKSDDKVKCNHCGGMVPAKYLAEHKRTKHPIPQAAAAGGSI